ncbi:peptide MFS transporter [Melioribacteraceae bacterium 4301-Me]|uniref:peptide MFS transporter n=1 Tax=Pyranulibacter aquaticus TaxID=3163344 RepID=UPI00359624E8
MFKKHPKGIIVLFFTEMWERFGFYTLMAILVLYMEKEFKWDDATKGNYYGWFLALVYFIPILGGWLGDKVLGNFNTVRIGAWVMSFGFAFLFLSSANAVTLFFIGLFLIAFGTGIFKVNIAVLVGNLYHDKLELKDAGFNIYYMGVNLGAAIAPLAATLLFNLFGNYNVSFAAAGLGLLICIIIFELGKKNLIVFDYRKQSSAAEIKNQNYREIPKEEFKQRIATLVILFLIVSFFWVGFYQNGFALTLFAERSTIISNILRPETYQFFNPFFILTLTPLMLAYFSKLNKAGKEPATPVKILIGMFIMGIAMAIMIPASLLGGNLDQNNMSPLWLISTYLVVTLAEILISPLGLSFVTKVAPPKIQGLMMGGWFGATALGSYGSGFLGKFYSDFQHHQYFLILTGILTVSVILLLIFMNKLKRFAG